MAARSPVQRRGIVAGLTLTLIGVLGLDTTAIVAAPSTPAVKAQPASPLPPTQLRMITWSGMTWMVVPPGMPSPGQGPQTDSKKAAYVDSNGHLHLRIIRQHGAWQSVTLQSLTPPSYGRYRFTVNGSTAAFQRNVVLGMFLFKSGAARFTQELDIEDSQNLTGIRPPNNAQFVVQPYTKPHHARHYRIGASVSRMVQELNWQPNHVTFSTRKITPRHSHLVNRFNFTGKDVPTPDGEHLYVNLWLINNHPPKGHGTRHIVLDSLTH